MTHFVAGLGTSGTFIGSGRRLRQLVPGIRLVSVQPDSPLHGIEGLKHMATAIVPGIYDPGPGRRRARSSDGRGVSPDAPPRTRGGAVRRPIERRGAGGLPARGRIDRARRRRHHLSRRRRPLPQRELLGSGRRRAGTSSRSGTPHDGARARHGPRGMASRRIRTSAAALCSGSAAGDVSEAFALRTRRTANAGGDSWSDRRSIARPKRGRRKRTASSSASTIRIRTTRRCRRRSISSTPGPT